MRAWPTAGGDARRSRRPQVLPARAVPAGERCPTGSPVPAPPARRRPLISSYFHYSGEVESLGQAIGFPVCICPARQGNHNAPWIRGESQSERVSHDTFERPPDDLQSRGPFPERPACENAGLRGNQEPLALMHETTGQDFPRAHDRGMNPNGKQVVVVIGHTSRWQSNGSNTVLAHGRTRDGSRLPPGARCGVGGAIAQKFAREGFFVVGHGGREIQRTTRRLTFRTKSKVSSE